MVKVFILNVSNIDKDAAKKWAVKTLMDKLKKGGE